MNRRHLTVGQRAALAVELTKLAKQIAAQAAEAEKPNPNPTPNNPDANQEHDEDLPDFLTKAPVETSTPVTQEQAAAALGVSTKSVGEAAHLAKNDPERFEAVKSGKTSLNAAVTESKDEAKPQDQGLLGKSGTIPNQYRTECADMMAASHGDKFAEAVRNDTILRDQELRAFMKLPIQDQKQITGLVARGWKVREAVKFAKGIFEKDDPIRDLLNLAIMRDGRAVTTLDGHTILILSDAVLKETKGEFLLAYVNQTLEAQRKPETTTAPVDNSVGKALDNAKPGKSSHPEPSSAGSKDATQKPAASTKTSGKSGKAPSKESGATKPAAKKAAKQATKQAPKK